MVINFSRFLQGTKVVKNLVCHDRAKNYFLCKQNKSINTLLYAKCIVSNFVVLKTLLSATRNEEKNMRGWISVGGSTSPFFLLQMKVQAVAVCSSNRQSSFLLLTLSARVVDLLLVPGSERQHRLRFRSLSRPPPTPSCLVSIGGKPRVPSVVQSNNSPCSANASFWLTDFRPQRSSLLKNTADNCIMACIIHLSLEPGKVRWNWKCDDLEKKWTRETSMAGCSAYSPSVVMHSFLERHTSWWKARAAGEFSVDAPCRFSPRGTHPKSI